MDWEDVTLTDWLTLLAIVVGPIVAVLITRWLDDRRARRKSRQEVFQTLMRTRRTRLLPEHVGALNLIEFEFAKNKRVMQHWRELFTHFGTAHARRPDEELNPTMDNAERQERNRRFDQRLQEERQRILVRMLHAMASALKFPVEQLEIFEGGYTPQGWADVEAEQTAVRKLFAEIYLNRRVLPIGVFDYSKMTNTSPVTPPAEPPPIQTETSPNQ